MLVDTIVPPRSHDHEDADAPIVAEAGPLATSGAGDGTTSVHLSGRTRQNKLVHLTGPASWLGQLIDVRIEHAGAYALRGHVA